MQVFVGDLLDMRQLTDGVFSLTENEFNPNEIFDSVCNIFSPQAML